jgi:hypothetical protein
VRSWRIMHDACVQYQHRIMLVPTTRLPCTWGIPPGAALASAAGSACTMEARATTAKTANFMVPDLVKVLWRP